MLNQIIFESNYLFKTIPTDKNESISLFNIYSGISRGDGKVRLKIKGSWTKENGLRLQNQDQIATPLIEMFYGRKLIMSVQHVR